MQETPHSEACDDASTSLAIQQCLLHFCRGRVAGPGLQGVPTVQLHCWVDGAIRAGQLQLISFCFSSDDLLGHSFHNWHHHGSSRGVAEPH